MEAWPVTPEVVLSPWLCFRSKAGLRAKIHDGISHLAEGESAALEHAHAGAAYPHWRRWDLPLKQLGFKSEYYPPGFAILSRDEIQMAALEREASQDSSRIARERREDGLYNRSYNDSSKWEFL